MANQLESDNKISVLGTTIWFVTVAFFMYEFFLRTFIGSLAHQVIPDLGLNAETFSIVGSAYFVIYAVMQMPVGALVDKFGLRKVMIFATLVCAFSNFLFAYSSGFYSAVLSRTLMGFGSSFAFVSLLVVVVDWFPKRNFALFAGVSQFVGTMGPLLSGGPLILFMGRYHLTWRHALMSVGYFGILLCFLSILFIRKKDRGGNNEIIYLKLEQPLTKSLLALLRNRQAWLIAFYSATSYVSMAILGALWGTEYLQVRGLSQSSAADIVSIAWLGYAIGCPLMGAISDLTKRRIPTMLACSILGVFSTVFIIFGDFQYHVWMYGLLFFILGLAATGQNVGFAAITEHVNEELQATSLGLNNTIIVLFSAIVPPIASYFIYLSASGAKSSSLTPNDFITGFLCMPMLYVISVLLCFFIKETYCKPQKEIIFLRVPKEG